jgi:preprotein translocase subunit SecD
VIHNVLQYGFGTLAAACLLGAWLLRPQRIYLVWAFACTVIAALAARYDSFWPVPVFGLMTLWALIGALPVMRTGWRLNVGLAAYLLVGGVLALYPTYHDERYGKASWIDANADAEQRTAQEAAAKRGDRGFKAYLLSNIPFRLVRGLDLKGGMRLVYTVDVDEAIRDKRDRYYDDVRAAFAKALPNVTGYQGEGQPTVEQMQKLADKVKLSKVRGRVDSVQVKVLDPAVMTVKDADGKPQQLLSDAFLSLFLTELTPIRSADPNELTLRVRSEIATQIRDRAVVQAKDTIGRRVDGLGLKEAAISVRDEDIIIEIPGQDEKAFQEIKEIISQTARLEFKMVDDEVDFFEQPARNTKAEDLPKGLSFSIENAPVGPGKTRPIHVARLALLKGEKIDEALKRFKEWTAKLQPGDDHEIGYGRVFDYNEETEKIEESGWRSYYLWSKADVTGDMVRDAQARPDQSQKGLGGWNVSLEFTPLGAERFEQTTAANVKKRFAIILDGKTESAPVIQERIGGGSAQITMGSGNIQQQMDDARKLELVLRSGALPAPISRSNEQLIGPSLGRDSIQRGIKGAAGGALLVITLMLLYYRAAGMVANIAVTFNLFLQVVVLSMFSASMTLPGICGLALTMGIAVDANVLINERIMEEFAHGKSARAALATGYDKAFSAILDGHVTTLIGALILAQFGTGPIKGFAVTLIVGVTCSLYTAVVITRLLFELWVRFKRSTHFGLG